MASFTSNGQCYVHDAKGAYQQPHGEEHKDDTTQEFPDVPGSESMEFMEKMMANLRRVVQQGGS